MLTYEQVAKEVFLDREEGFRALFKGGPARVIRSSPQFGFTLLGDFVWTLFCLIYPWTSFAGYETLKNLVRELYSFITTYI